MTQAVASVPRNVLRFEVALYASLMLDALSAAIQTGIGTMSEPGPNFMSAVLVLGLVLLVGHAARHRSNKARIALAVMAGLSCVALLGNLNLEGLQAWTVIDVISTALTAFGVYSSFTGDARDWFTT